MRSINKTIGWFTGSFTLIILLLILSFVVMRQTKDAEEKRNTSNKIITNAELLLSNLKDAETGQRGYLLTGDEAYLEPYLTALDNYDNQLLELRRQVQDNPTQLHHLDVLTPQIDSRLAMIKSNVDLRRNQDMNGVIQQIRAGQGKQLMNQIRKEIHEFVEAENDSLRQHEARFQSSQQNLLFTIVFGNGLVLLMSIFGVYWMRRGIQAQADKESAEIKERYARSLIEASLDPLVTLNMEGKIISANEATVKITGVARDKLIGSDISLYFTDPEKARSSHQEVFAKGFIVEYPLSMRHVSGEVFDVLYNASPYRNQSGEMEGMLGVARNITEQKRSQETQLIHGRIATIFAIVPHDEMFNEVLKVVLSALRSPFGVFGYLDEAGDLLVPTMTRQIWDKCQVPEKTVIFPRETWGDSSWPTSLREKRVVYSNESSTNIPEGHVGIQRHISMPILFQGETIGLFQVANKETDYTEADINTLDTIAKQVAPLLNARLLER